MLLWPRRSSRRRPSCEMPPCRAHGLVAMARTNCNRICADASQAEQVSAECPQNHAGGELLASPPPADLLSVPRELRTLVLRRLSLQPSSVMKLTALA